MLPGLSTVYDILTLLVPLIGENIELESGSEQKYWRAFSSGRKMWPELHYCPDVCTNFNLWVLDE